MNRPQRSTMAGRAYLDLQHLAKRTGRSMQALLPMFASERWLARLAASPHRTRFVLKGGVLLAALGNRRPTQDADLLALNIANDHDTVISYVNEIAAIDLPDGITFDPATTTATTIRENDLYLGVRLSMDCALATARIRLKLDINFGDPVTPGPGTISLPTLLDGPAVDILGYPVVTVLAEKLGTAVQLGEADTRIRDYVDLYNLTGSHPLEFPPTRAALLATAAHRRITLRPVSTAIGQFPAPGPAPTAPTAPALAPMAKTCPMVSPSSYPPSSASLTRSFTAPGRAAGTRPPGNGDRQHPPTHNAPTRPG